MTPGPTSKLLLSAWLALAGLLALNLAPQPLFTGGDLPGLGTAHCQDPAVPPLLVDSADEETSQDDLDDRMDDAERPASVLGSAPQQGPRPQHPAGPSLLTRRVMSCLGARGPPRELPTA